MATRAEVRPQERGARRVLRWIEPEDNPSAVVYGIIAVGLLIAAEEPALETYPRVVSGTAIALGLYWVAHGYADILGRRFAARMSLSLQGIAEAMAHELSIMKGATTPLLALLVAWAAGASLQTGVSAALWTAVGTLLLVELLAGVRAGLRLLPLVASAALGAGLGGTLLLVKQLLH